MTSLALGARDSKCQARRGSHAGRFSTGAADAVAVDVAEVGGRGTAPSGGGASGGALGGGASGGALGGGALGARSRWSSAIFGWMRITNTTEAVQRATTSAEAAWAAWAALWPTLWPVPCAGLLAALFAAPGSCGGVSGGTLDAEAPEGELAGRGELGA